MAGDFAKGGKPGGGSFRTTATPVSSDLSKLAAELGIDTSVFGGQSQEDEYVSFRWQAGTQPLPSKNPRAPVSKGIVSDSSAGAQRVALQQFAQLAKTNPALYRRTQEQLLARGFYDTPFYSASNRRRLPLGLFDLDTAQAFARAASQAEYTGDLDEVLFGMLTPEQMEALNPFKSALDEQEPTPISPFSVEDQKAELRRYAQSLMLPVDDQQLDSWAHEIVRGQIRGPTTG